MSVVLMVALDAISVNYIVTTLAIEREAYVISSVTDQVPFVEYNELCNDIREAFPNLVDLVDSSESALVTMIAEDLKEDGIDGNLLPLEKCVNCLQVPTLEDCVMHDVLIQLDHIVLEVLPQPNCIMPEVLLLLCGFKTSTTTGDSIHYLFFGNCGDTVSALQQFMGSKAALISSEISCLCWTFNHANVKVLPFNRGPPGCPIASSAFFSIVDLIDCRLCVKPTARSYVKSQRPAPFAFQPLFSILPFR